MLSEITGIVIFRKKLLKFRQGALNDFFFVIFRKKLLKFRQGALNDLAVMLLLGASH